MVNMKNYVSPTVLRRVSVQLESPILAGSVVDKIEKIETTGQQVETKDFSDYSSFTHDWGTN